MRIMERSCEVARVGNSRPVCSHHVYSVDTALALLLRPQGAEAARYPDLEWSNRGIVVSVAARRGGGLIYETYLVA